MSTKLRVSYFLLPNELVFMTAETNRCFKAVIDDTPENREELEKMTEKAVNGIFFEHVDAWPL